MKPATLLHLQEVLDTAGIVAASLVTEVIEQEKTPKISVVGKEWGLEELRLIALESVRPHLVDLLRLILEALLAWHFLHFAQTSIDNVVEITLTMLFFVVGFLGICLICRYHEKSDVFRKKSPIMH